LVVMPEGKHPDKAMALSKVINLFFIFMSCLLG
jgi:hypothetical protein